MHVFKNRSILKLAIAVLSVFTILVVVQIILFDYMRYVYIYTSFAALMAAMCGVVVWYLSDNKEKTESWMKRNRYYLGIVLIIFLTYLPLLTQGFLFYDDYWVFTGQFNDNVTTGIMYARPFQTLLSDLFYYVHFETGYVIKWFTVLCMTLYGLILFKWIEKKSNKLFYAFMITTMLCVFSVVADCVAYGSIVSFAPGVCAAGISVILFDYGYTLIKHKQNHIGISFIALSGIFIVFSFLLYQIATASAFVFLFIHVYFNKEKKSALKYAVLYCLLFVAMAAADLVIINLITAGYGFGTRSAMTALSDIPQKISWFVKTVIPACLDRISAAIFGRSVIMDKIYWYHLSYIIPSLRKVISVALIALAVFAYGKFILRRKNILDAILLVFFGVMSFYCFLVLKESSYLSYYAFPLMTVLMFMVINGVIEVVKTISNCASKKKEQVNPENKKAWKIAAIILTCVLAVQCNLYCSQFWVGQNRDGYEYLKDTIAKDAAEKQHIHVYGVITPGQANVYSQMAAQIALNEIGYDPSHYTITSSNDEYYISVIQYGTMEEIKSKITQSEYDFLSSHYYYENTYNTYQWKYEQLDEEDLLKLKSLFEKSGQLPKIAKDYIIVDLRWIKGGW